mgnify:CR=1 FL=1
MNKKAIFEIGNIIHVRYKDFFKREKLTPKEITKTFEYKIFKKQNPELCNLAEQ